MGGYALNYSLGETMCLRAIVVKMKDLSDCLQTAQEIKSTENKSLFQRQSLTSNPPIPRV